MTLAARLDEIRAGGAKRIPEDKRAIMGAANRELVESGIMNDVIKVGDRLPPFALPNAFGETIDSSELLRAGPVVLTAFRGVW